MKPKKKSLFFIFLLLALIFQSAWTNQPVGRTAPSYEDPINGPFVSEEVTPVESVELSSLPLAAEEEYKEAQPRRNPLQGEADQGQRGTWDRPNVSIDPLIQSALSGDTRATPSLLLGFDGTGNPTACGGCSPPDTNGDVGPSHYIQMVNATKVAIYNKSGTLLSGPFDLSTFWSSGNCTSDFGDPIVLYDPIAKRWLLSQFASPNHMCIAVSKTSNPLSTYWLYEFNVVSFPDYFKFGVWPDGYYMSANEATYTAYAFDRSKMLSGLAATFQKFTGGTNLYLPSDLDGSTAPPSGDPNHFYTFKDNSFHGGSDRLEVYAFDVDWVTPANSTFTLEATIPISSFTYTVCGLFNFNCIRQSGTAQKFDAVSEWPMFRFPFRNFGSRQSLVGTFTVGGGLGETGSAIRWFELRNTGAGWTLYQEGTFDPGDGHDRFMPSIAMDRAGNIALGYSVSSSTMFPAIRYTVHRIGDALGSMQTEATMRAGGGSQTGSNRWGDYSAMSVDPSDDLSFWYTNEYYSSSSSSNWKTRVGKFRIVNTVAYTSAGAQDGWILETTETSNTGGTMNNTASTLNLGDDAAKRQFRSILSFNSASLPDTAFITKVTLKLKQQGIVGGGNPVTAFQGFMSDIKKGLFGAGPLQLTDFNAAANTTVGPLSPALASGWYNISLTSGKNFINKVGYTQIRVRLKLDDNNNAVANYLRVYSGNAGSANRPQLVIEYYVP